MDQVTQRTLRGLVRQCAAEQSGAVPRGEKHGIYFDATTAERQLLREVAHVGRMSQGAVLRRGIVLVADQFVKDGAP